MNVQYNVVSGICLFICVFVPPVYSIVGVCVLIMVHLLFTQSYVDVLFMSTWILWYLLQLYIPVLLPDPYGLTPLLTVPLLIGTSWVVFGLEKKRQGAVRPSFIVLFSCAYFLLALIVSNRPSPVVDLLIITVYYSVVSGSLCYLGAGHDLPYFMISTTWILIIPVFSVFFTIIRIGYLLILVRATVRKYQWEREKVTPVTKKTIKKTRIVLPTSTSGLAQEWRTLQRKHQIDPEQQPVPPPLPPPPVVKKVTENEEKMKAILARTFHKS